MIPGGQGKRKARKPPRKVAPTSTPRLSVSNTLARADAPLTQAVRTARKRVERAQRRLPQRPTPAIPDLPGRPTRAQAKTIQRLSQRSLQGQVPAGPDRARRLAQTVRELQEDPRTRARLRPVREAARTPLRNARVRTGMDLLRARPEAFGANARVVERLHRLAVRNALPERTRSALEAIGRGVETQLPVRAKAGRPHARIKAAGVGLDLTALGRGAQNLIAAGTSLDQGDLGPRNLLNRSLKDVGILGTAPVLGGYQVATGAYEAARGDTSRLEGLARGVAEGVKEEALHPGRSFSEHPLLTTLDVAALATVGGRAYGAAARGLSGGRLQSTVRSPLALVDDAGTRLVQSRRYSKDALRREFQKGRDSQRQPLRDADGKVVTATVAGREVPVLLAKPGMERARLLRRRGNFDPSQANSVERLERARDEAFTVGRRRKAGGVKGADAGALVSMVARGTLLGKDLKAELKAHRARVVREIERRDRDGDWSDSARRDAAHERVKLIDRVLADPKVMRQADRIVERGTEVGRTLRSTDPELVNAQILERRSAERAPLVDPAIEHMGARHFTVEEHRALEKAAKGREREAAAAVRAATSPTEKRAAQSALATSRRERIAVSGRHPDLVRAHEQARGQVSDLEQRIEQARDVERKAQATRDRVLGGQASRRGGRHARVGIRTPGERPSTRATAAERAKLETATRKAAQARQARQRLEKEHRRAKDRLRSTPMPDVKAGLRKADGRFLSNREIEDHLRARGRDPETVAKLPDVLPEEADAFGKRAHHTQMRVDSRPDLNKQRLTGELYRQGAVADSAAILHDAGVRQVTQLAKARQIDHFIGEAGLRHPAYVKALRGQKLTKAEQRIVDRGGYLTGKEAEELIARLRRDTGDEFVAVRGFSSKLPRDMQEVIRDELQGPAGMESLGQRLLNDRLLAPEELGVSRARNIVVVPKELVDQLNSHLKPAGEIERFVQMLNKPFRMAVLPQPRWLTGNFVEPYFVRLPGVGSGVVNIPGMVRDIRITNRAVRMLRERGTPEAKRLADEIEGHHLGGLFVGRRGASVMRTRDDFKTWGHIVRRFPVMDDLANAAGAAWRFVTWPLEQFFRVNRVAIESPAQKAMFGKMLRAEMQELQGSWGKAMRAQDVALKQALDGLLGTPEQERFMRYQHELLGKYEGFGPTTRRAVQSIAPFLPWALAAARFVYWTMPMHRTAQTALLLKTQAVVQEAWDAEHKDAPPGSLRGAARTKDGGFVDFARYTPYGLTLPIVENDIQGVTDQFMPQVSGLVAALQGKDAFNRDLQVPKTAENPRGAASLGQKLAIGGYGLAEALVPYLSTIRRLQEHGETPLSTSTFFAPQTKPGTGHGMSALRRTFDPFRPVHLKGGATVVQAGEGGSSVLDRVNEHRGVDVQTGPADPGALLDEINRYR